MRDDALPSVVVVDAGVGLKWVGDEPGSEVAAALATTCGMIATALFWVEAANVLATKERRGELSRSALEDAWRDLLRAPMETIPIDPASAGEALGLALELCHPAYDCCYLELALARRTAVVTADRRFRALADRQSSLAGCIVHLDEIRL
ncbi:MAG: type II toxin-antitoxin system VapC family toxin [Geminicoccaceae bacterium]